MENAERWAEFKIYLAFQMDQAGGEPGAMSGVAGKSQVGWRFMLQSTTLPDTTAMVSIGTTLKFGKMDSPRRLTVLRKEGYAVE